LTSANLCTGLSTNITKNRLNIFPEILKNISKYHKKVSKYLEKSPNICYFGFKNTAILNYSGQTFQNYHAVVGVKEEDSGDSILPASAILENYCFNTLYVSMGIRWTGLFLA